MNEFQEFVRKHIPYDWKPTSGGWISGNCPMCVINGEPRPDTKGRGGFLFQDNSIVYHCFNCGYAAQWEFGGRITEKFKKLLEEFGIERKEIQRFILKFKVYENLFSDDTNNHYNKKIKNKEVLSSWKEISLPDNSQKLFELDTVKKHHVNKIDYIVNRKLDFFDDWYTSDSRGFYNRIILPLRYNDKIVGYTARHIDKNKTKAKYLSSIPNNFVFNLDRQKNEKKFVIVSEGFFDALFTDGVGIGSNEINDQQASLIEELNKDIIVIPDANKPSREFALNAIDRGWSVSFPPWEEDIIDVNDAVIKYGRLFTVYSILKFRVSNKIKSKIQVDFWCK